jgi:CHAT domain-containing protein/Tfp pilus assembly protein PilF
VRRDLGWWLATLAVGVASLAGAQTQEAGSTPQALNASGEAARRSADFARAAAIFELAQRAARSAGDAAELGTALNGAADAWFRQGEFEKARANATESVALHEREHLDAGLAQAWNTIGNVHHGKAEYAQALECYQRSLALREPLGDQPGIAQSVNNIGAVHKGLGQYPEALVSYRRALAIFETLGQTRPAAIVADNIGVVYFQQGDYGPALDYTKRALAANQALDNRYGTAKSFDTLGNIYRAQGAYARALDAFAQALALRQAINARASEAETVNNIGLVHFSQGDHAAAIASYRRALRLNTEIGDKALTTEALLNIGAAAWRDGQRARADANYRAGLAISEREGYQQLTAEILHGLGDMAVARGRLADGRALLARSLALRERSADHAGVSATLTSIAAAQLAAKAPADAVVSAQRAVDTAARFEQPELLWEARTMLGIANRRLGRLEAADRALREAIDGVERLRRQVVGTATRRAGFFEARLSPYHELIALAVDRGSSAEALAIAERAKARALLDLLQARAPDGASLLPAADGAGETAPFQLADTGAIVRDAATVAIEYVVADDRAAVCAITRDAGGPAAACHAIPIGHAAITALAERVRDRIAARDLRWADDGRRLHELLLAPVRRQLTGRQHVIIVPDGPLWNVPFQALPDAGGRFLIESAAVSYAPSLTALRDVLRRPRAAGTSSVLAMGKADFGTTPPGSAPVPMALLSPLPDAERQVRLVQAAYGAGRAAAYVGADASEDRFKREAPSRAVLHLATHGVLDASSPLYSRIVLSPGPAASREDGQLEAWEILRLRLDADVVVLSACDTARGRIAAGEGVIGMTWALFAAGARAAVVSQWQVESSSTTTLMAAFHRGLAAGRGSKADALRTASLEVLRAPEHGHPFYWAGFVLVGQPFP